MTTTSNAPAAIDHLSVAERAARGKAARAEVPRSSHAAWAPPARRPDPVEILELQAPSRVPDLVPIRYGRMLVSPFTFYRGAAAIMASDLSLTPRSGLQAQICGDAHISNFGVFAAPDRKLIFDVNDFDETLPGPWEWDVKRMAASIEIACRQRDLKPGKRRAAVTAAVREYRMAMRRFAGQGNLEVWYARLDEDDLVARFESDIRRQDTEDLRRLARKARNKDSVRALSKLTHEVDGELRFLSAPPLLVPIEELLPADDARDQADIFQSLIRTYRSTLPADRRHLLESYRYVHIARKVVQSFQKSAGAQQVANELSELSEREQQVLDLLAQGLIYKEIGEKLGISYETVHTYIRRIYEKLQVRTRTEAVAKFLRN